MLEILVGLLMAFQFWVPVPHEASLLGPKICETPSYKMNNSPSGPGRHPSVTVSTMETALGQASWQNRGIHWEGPAQLSGTKAPPWVPVILEAPLPPPGRFLASDIFLLSSRQPWTAGEINCVSKPHKFLWAINTWHLFGPPMWPSLLLSPNILHLFLSWSW